MTNEVDSLKQVLINTLNGINSAGSEAYDAAKKAGKTAIDFAQEQIPDVINELMRWEFTYHLTYAILGLCGLIFLIVAIILLVKQYKRSWYKTEQDNFWFACAMTGIIMLIPLGTTVTITVNNSLTVLKIATAPKIFLISYCNDLVKGAKTHDH